MRNLINTISVFIFDKSDEVRQTETCYTNKYFIVNPMAYWTTEVRDKYIAKYGIEVNPVYEKYGLKRCGCIMCPMCSDNERRKEAKLFPKYALNFRLLCDRIIKKRQASDKLVQFTKGGGRKTCTKHTSENENRKFNANGEALFRAYLHLDD